MKHDITLDFDETLFSTSIQIKRFLNQLFGIEIPLMTYLCGHSLHSLVLEHLPPGSVLDEGDLYEILGRDFLASMAWHDDIRPMTGVSEIIPELAKKYNLHIATARQASSRLVVETLLERFFPKCISSTHFVWTHLGNKEFKGIPKREFVKSLKKPYAYVDDNPKETEAILGVADTVILLDPEGHHTNVHIETHCVTSWEDIGKLLLP